METFTTDKRLPRDPVRLLKIVRRCVKQCESDPNYTIYPRLYHSRLHTRDGESTQVCTSGCVIAKFFEVPAEESFSPWDFDKRNKKILLAIDQIEIGNFEEFYRLLNKEMPEGVPKAKTSLNYGYGKTKKLRRRIKWLLQLISE